jgi:DNA mismatch repair protein MutS2
MFDSNKLEFNKILNHIAKFCYTSKGKEHVNSLSPFETKTEMILEGKYVTEARDLINEAGYPPIASINDPLRDLHLSKIEGAVLTARSVFNIFELAICSAQLKSYLVNNRALAPELSDFATFLFEDKLFERYISTIFDSSGEIKDTASKTLQSLRKEIRERSEELRRFVSKIAKDLTDKDLSRDNYLTLRDGRLVVPVKAEYKRQLKGIIHSESSTGQTVYIEPEETLHLNNEIVSLNFAEKREIERILKEVTHRIRNNYDDLILSLETVTRLDSIFARGNYSIEIVGNFPRFEDSEPITIYGGRHPLLLIKNGLKKTVPFNLSVQAGNLLIITGPNAGGKTVFIKSVGLLALMAQSGIHIPAGVDTNLHKFDKILVDIGDSQSIDDDLSTFSSHLSNIKRIIDEADDSSLVLIDEIGTGTDPDSGAAISRAVLMALHNKGSMVFCTTHLSALKALATEVPGFYNASMSFDTDELKPAYLFRQGIPGSSYAFEIMMRLGFEKAFIEGAVNYVEDVSAGLEKILLEVEQREQELNKKLDHFERENTRLTGLSNLYAKKIKELDKEKNKILRDAKENAAKFIEESNKEIQKVIKDIKESQASKEASKSASNKVTNLKKELGKLTVKPVQEEDEVDSIIEIGDTVRIRESETYGEVIEITPDKKNLIISTGPLKISVKTVDCAKVSRREQRKEQRKSAKFEIYSDVSYKLDIRGERAIEIENKVERFIDDAYIASLNRVEIIHGKGTGALKKVVRELLTKHPKVKNFYFAPVDAGGEGVTIIEFLE